MADAGHLCRGAQAHRPLRPGYVCEAAVREVSRQVPGGESASVIYSRRAMRLRSSGGFRLFWTASTVSGFGSQITALAVAVLIVTTPGGTAADA
jgi:hypothetical protein